MTNLRSRFWGSAFLVTGPVLVPHVDFTSINNKAGSCWSCGITGSGGSSVRDRPDDFAGFIVFPKDANFLTMVSHLLPQKHRCISVSATFLLLLYSLVSLYLQVWSIC